MVDDTTTKHHFCERCARDKVKGEGWPSLLNPQWDDDDLPDEVRAALEAVPLEDIIRELFDTETTAPNPKAFGDAFDAPDDIEAFDSPFSPPAGLDLNEFLLPNHRAEPALRCSRCGTTWDTLQREGRAGCAGCYGAFRDQLGDIMNTVQRGETHLGKSPRAAQKRTRRLEQLRKRRDSQLEMLRNRLQEAVAQEKYEDAAQLRDKIKIVSGTVIGG